MRTFIAIDISDSIREALAQIQSHLRYSGADVKWVEPGNIHLTLKFLGEISEEKCEIVKRVLDGITGSAKSFEATIKDVGAFPSANSPRVVWVGLDKGAGEARAIAEKIDDALSKIGFEKESRPFVAHLTIGRVRTPKNKEALKEKMATCQLPSAKPHLVTSIVLFQSTLTPKGSIYTKLHESYLR